MKSEAYLMDNMEYMATIPDKWFSLAICDPPYGIDVAKMAYTQEDNRPVKQKKGATLRVKKLKYKHGDWDKSPPPQEYFDEVCRISKAQIIFGIEYFEWVGVGSGRIKWIKGVPEGVSFKGYELAYCSLIYDEVELPLLWAGMFQAKSLSDPMIQQGNKQLNEKRIHPTHKPVMLYDSIYRDYLPQGGRVFDPNLGGGSSRIAADKAGNINFYATEIDPDYFADQEKRFRQYKSQLTLKF